MLLANPNHLLGAQPGAGKTPTTLTAVAEIKARRPSARFLLVGPGVILDNVWQQEAARWSHTNRLRFDLAHRHSGADREHLWFEGRGDIVTCTVDTLDRFLAACHRRSEMPVTRMIVDESQMIKSPSATRSRVAHCLAEIIPTWLLSGTPTPQGVIDCWSPGRIASGRDSHWDADFTAWRKRHFVQQNEYTWRPQSAKVEQSIRDEFAKCACSITLGNSGSDVPEPFYSTHLFAWDDEHFRRIKTFAATGTVRLPDGMERTAETMGGYLAMLRQLTGGFLYTDPEGAEGHAVMFSIKRIDAVDDVIDSVSGPVLVPIFFKHEVSALQSRFKDRARIFVGGTPVHERTRIIDDWNADKIPILICSPGAMGHGINLQHGSAQTIVWHSHTFDYAQREQLNARLVRSGQKKPVSIISLVANAGLDQAVLSALASKRSGEQAMFDALDIRNKFKYRSQSS